MFKQSLHSLRLQIVSIRSAKQRHWVCLSGLQNRSPASSHPFPTTLRCTQALQLQHLPPTTAPCLCPAMPSLARHQLLQPYNPVNLGLPFSAVLHLYLDHKLFCSEMGSGRALKQSRRSGSYSWQKKVLRRYWRPFLFPTLCNKSIWIHCDAIRSESGLPSL